MKPGAVDAAFLRLVFGGVERRLPGVDGIESGCIIRGPSQRWLSGARGWVAIPGAGCTVVSGLVFGGVERRAPGVDESGTGCMIRGPSLRR